MLGLEGMIGWDPMCAGEMMLRGKRYMCAETTIFGASTLGKESYSYRAIH